MLKIRSNSFPERRKPGDVFALARANEGDFPSGAEGRNDGPPSRAETLGTPAPGPPPLRVVGRSGPAAVENRRKAERIQIVTADGNLRRLLRSFLEHAGFDVVCCADVDQGAAACSNERETDLLLVDLDSLGGPALRLALSLTEHRQGLPVVALHGADSGSELRRAAKEHRWRLVLKPVLVPQLLGVICSVLDSARGRTRSNLDEVAASPKSAA